MSLDWNISKVTNHQDLIKDGKLDPVTNSLIFLTMGVGLGEITDKNADEFAARLELWQDVIGATLQKVDVHQNIIDIRITRKDVLRHIGLRTNVSKESWSKFLAKLRREAEYRVRSAKRNAERDAAAA